MQKSLPALNSGWMLVAALGFAMMGAFVKLGATKFTSSELVFYRSVFGLIMIGLFLHNRRLSVKTDYLKVHLLRSSVGFVALLMFFYAIAHLPLATAITLSNTSALFLGVLTPLLLKEKQNKLTYLTLVTGFIGVSFLLQPNLDHGDNVATLIGLTAGFGAAIAYLCVRKLGTLHEPDWRTVFYFTLISAIGAATWMLAEEMHTLAFNDLPVLLGLGASATVAQLAMTRAYRTGNTLFVACLGYTTPLLASLFGWLFWEEMLQPMHWFGISLIIGSGVANSVIKNWRKRSAKR